LEEDKTPEDEIKELKAEVARLTNVIEQFKKMYNNWYKFKHHLGL
jgi:HAMP domain-containing protein